jgi:hypothetical protein
MFAWAVWAWLVLSLVLQVGAAMGERVATGTAVVRRASGLADLLSAPMVRNAVRTSLAGGMMARVALGGVPVAAAEPVDRPALFVSVSPQTSSQPTHGPHFWASPNDLARDIPAGAIVYTVQPGDNLVRIAERFYKDGDKWHLVYESNQGRQMADGRTFDRAGVIQPGWELVVPEPTIAIDSDAHGRRWYTVRRGDSLAGISARLLGDESRWPELYAANVGMRLDDLHVLNDPRLIWPGLRLQLPEETAPAPDASASTSSEPSVSDEPSPEPSGVQDRVPAATASSPTVTPVPPDPTAIATESTAQPTQLPVITPVILPTPMAITRTDTQIARHESNPRVSAAAGAAAGASLALVGIAGGALVLRRRRRGPLPSRAESDVSVRAGFAEANSEEPSSDDELAAATTIATRLSRALATVLNGRDGARSEELPIDATRLVGVRHGRSSTTLLLQMPIASRAVVFGSLRDAATRAFGRKSDVEAVVSRDGDVVIRLTGLVDQLEVCEPDEHSGAEAWPAPSMLLRLGLLADRQLFAANWDALSHVLVAAPLSQSAEAILGGLLTSLVARRSPAQLGFVVLGGIRCLPEELLGLPHRLEPVADPQDEDSALRLLNRVRQVLEERVATGATDAPDLVVVIPELAQLSAEHQLALGPVMLHGPLHRVRVVAGSTRRAVDLVQDSSLVPEFGTRLVLRAADDEESTVLLGSADATELGTGGHLLARLEARVPLQAYGYRVEADRLARLAAAISDKGVAAEWWDSGGGSAEHSEAEGSPAEPSNEHALEAPDEDRLEDPGEEEDKAALGPGAGSLVNIDQSAQAPVEPPEPPSEADGVESSASSMPEDLGPAGTAAGDAQAEDTSSRVPSPSRNDSPTSGLTSGQLWSSATEPRPRLRGRFFGARELVYDGEVVWPKPGQPQEKAMELLVYLGVQDPSGVRAELLGDSLWSEDDDDESRTERIRKRRYTMRQALKKLVPGLEGNPIAPFDKKNPVFRLNATVIESDVHRFIKLVQEAKSLPPESACAAYEAALDLYGGNLLERPDVPPYRWMDEGPRLVDLRVKYAAMEHQARRKLADLLAVGPEDGLARAEELYIGLAQDDPLDHRLWEALARLHERRNDLLGLEASMRRLRSALVELGEGDDPERVIVPPALERVFTEIRTVLLRGRAA